MRSVPSQMAAWRMKRVRDPMRPAVRLAAQGEAGLRALDLLQDVRRILVGGLLRRSAEVAEPCLRPHPMHSVHRVGPGEVVHASTPREARRRSVST
ncbi:hypothetical protein GCM10010276_22460 [Streptomyces longisporus]|uniref:Uncharacterized protein n=1 Tax=Streptomyces longisporus TaxID=1948 RepID=A0ABN3LK14_STRLO